MKIIKVDKSASKGIVMGKPFLFEKPKLNINQKTITSEDIPEEIKKYEKAVALAEADLTELAKTNDIFLAHIEMVKDFTLYDAVVLKIKEENLNAEKSLEAAADELIGVFEAMEDEYMRERAADIKDIKERLIRFMQEGEPQNLPTFQEQVILIAKDLAPSDTATLDLNYVLGFITRDGGITSHVSIMAKNLGIPALVGVKDILDEVHEDDYIIMDASEGKIIINPDNETIKKYEELKSEQELYEKELMIQNHLPAVTKDGRRISLCANVGSVKDVKNAIEYHIDGVGLFRSEFLYMENNHFPTQEEQFTAYKEAVVLCKKELTIRTLDIGGDKELSYYDFEKEDNPFLGFRAIRISLERRDLFKTQLTAILRASAFGVIRIMFPMIISLEELYLAKEILNECKADLRQQNVAFDTSIEVGMMIETPASVICVEDFAKEVDFFSIGTNDLTQYLLAVDRGNKKVADMYNTFHPAVLKSIKKIIDAGHENHIKVGMCGEFAGDERAAKLLLGMGLDEFSMSAVSIPNIKYQIRKFSYKEAQELAENVLQKNTIKQINEVLGIF